MEHNKKQPVCLGSVLLSIVLDCLERPIDRFIAANCFSSPGQQLRVGPISRALPVFGRLVTN